VTVLFADVVHSMDIAAAVGAERLREIMTELVDRLARVVRRCGGTVDKFTGDGIMAVFGAPAALEDHALRACLAALDIQKESRRLADEVARDGVDLQLRVGLNSGQVIAGEIGSGRLGYTMVGEHVGMAQRMESVAPPGGVMLSESTAGLVKHAVELAERQMVHIKGADDPVPARGLLGVAAKRGRPDRIEPTLVGRQREVNTLTGILDRSMTGYGCVVGVVGPAGIGKTRLVGEAVRVAKSAGMAVFSTFCESHTRDIPFHVVARLLRVVVGTDEADDEVARARVRTQFPGADLQDLLLLDDLLGIANPDTALTRIDPDARRRRVTALINAAQLARTQPALYIIEDAHWIDEVSESMLVDFLAVIPQTPATVLINYRPEYDGALTRVPGEQTIALAPLRDSETSALIGELLGSDPSVGEVTALIAERAAGNPFFAEEMVRDLAERDVLDGDHGSYVCRADVAEISVPATLQAVIAARIDRLDAWAKRTLNAAAVIGSHFGTSLLITLGIDPAIDELVRAELVDQVRVTPLAEYAFRHPLIRAVAYESQLKSDRCELHRRLATAMQSDDPESVEENAALIAEHFDAAGDQRVAYAWHMRAAAWSTYRDFAAARLSWERAHKLADALPADDLERTGMCIAPLKMLCGNAFRVHESISERFEELRQLCELAGDKASLAIGMVGPIGEHLFDGRLTAASRVASEQITLIESIGDPTLYVGLSPVAMFIKVRTGEMADVLRFAEIAVELADGDPAKGDFLLVSPLASALAARGLARCSLGHPSWHHDLDQAVTTAASRHPLWDPQAIVYKYAVGIPLGMFRADDAALREIDEALHFAEAWGDEGPLGLARLTMGLALVHRASADHERGVSLLGQVRESCLHQRFWLAELPIANVYIAREWANHGDRDGAIPLMREAVDVLSRDGQQLGWGIPATHVLVETLLGRGRESDIQEAENTIERLAASLAGDQLVTGEVMLLRLQALLARARGDEAAYRQFVDRYRATATSYGFEGHMAMADALSTGTL
jgi:class 3 adenylate cyclase